MSIGMEKNILELLSAATVDNIWRYLNCRAVGEAAITPAASFSAHEALSSLSAEITYQTTLIFIHKFLSLICNIIYCYMQDSNFTLAFAS